MKLIYGLIRQINTCTSQQVLPIHIQPKQNTPILGKDNNVSENFRLCEDEKSILKKQEVERDCTNLVDKSLNI